MEAPMDRQAWIEALLIDTQRTNNSQSILIGTQQRLLRSLSQKLLAEQNLAQPPATTSKNSDPVSTKSDLSRQDFGPSSEPIPWHGGSQDLLPVSFENKPLKALILTEDLLDVLIYLLNMGAKVDTYRKAKAEEQHKHNELSKVLSTMATHEASNRKPNNGAAKPQLAEALASTAAVIRYCDEGVEETMKDFWEEFRDLGIGLSQILRRGGVFRILETSWLEKLRGMRSDSAMLVNQGQE